MRNYPYVHPKTNTKGRKYFFAQMDEMSDAGGLPDLDDGANQSVPPPTTRPRIIIDTGINPETYLRERGLLLPVVGRQQDDDEDEDEEEDEVQEEEDPNRKRDREDQKHQQQQPPPHEQLVPLEYRGGNPRHTHINCSLKKAQELLDLVDQRADATDRVEDFRNRMVPLEIQKREAKSIRYKIERKMFAEALALIPSVAASRWSGRFDDGTNAMLQAVTNVYQTDYHEGIGREEDDDEIEYRLSKVTIVFYGNSTTHNENNGPSQPGKKTLYVHMINGEFVRAYFSENQVVYSWIESVPGEKGQWEEPVLPQHREILNAIAGRNQLLESFSMEVLRLMKLNKTAYHGKTDQTRIFWRDHIIPKLQAIERLHEFGGGGGGLPLGEQEEEHEEEEQEQAGAKRTKSGRKPKKAAAPAPAPRGRPKSTGGKAPRRTTKTAPPASPLRKSTGGKAPRKKTVPAAATTGQGKE